MATIPSTNFTSAQVIEEAGGSIRSFNSNDTDVRTLAGVLTGSYSSADWAGKSSFSPFVPNAISWTTEEATNMGRLSFNSGGTYQAWALFPAYGAGQGAWTNVANGTQLKIKATFPTPGHTDFEVRVTNGGVQVVDPMVSGQEYTVAFNNNLVFEFFSTWWDGEPPADFILTINGQQFKATIISA
jgi:hypothetical protein